MNKIREKIQENLITLGEEIKNIHISSLYNSYGLKADPIETDLLTYDFSKQRINQKILDYLLEIPNLINLKESLDLLFAGKVVNPSEHVSVSHTLYRSNSSINNFELIKLERERIRSFLEDNNINQSYKNLICISIGGSRLGPELLYEFQGLDVPKKIYFCSSYDFLELKAALLNCEQKDTVVFACSKSFKTPEILKNLDYVKSWFSQDTSIQFEERLYGISADASAMTAHGIKETNQFLLLDSLGGRFSLWSAISLPAFVNADFEAYLDLLEGARLADEYTLEATWESNISVLMALLSVWNRNSLNINNHGIFTYNYKLRSLTKYIGQLSMESNGKSTNYESYTSPFFTTPLVWGGDGIESQHSTFQWLMQGKTETSCDFIGINDGNRDTLDSHEMLLSQVLAMTLGHQDKTNPYKTIRGNNPCSILQLDTLDLKSLGFLLALYEHKVFIEALILGVDSFDQWGVQLGKKLALNAKSNKGFLQGFYSSLLLPKS